MIHPKMGLAVGIASGRKMAPIDWCISLCLQNWPSNMNVAYVPMRGLPVDKAREAIAKATCDLGAPYLLFLDDDTEIPMQGARHLIETMQQADPDVMVVGGIYPSRRANPEPIVYKGNGAGPFWRWKKDTIFECTGIGTGCMLIRTEVFKHLPEPWFKTVDTEHGAITDDLWFCDLVTQAGFKILADAFVICKHWDVATEICYEFPDDCYPMLPLGKEKLLKGLPKGWMHMEELDWLTDQASRSKTIVELGSYMGRSTVAMARSTSGTVYSIDAFKPTLLSSERIEFAAEPNLFEKFKKNVSQCENIKWMKMDHADCQKTRWPEEVADMVFIDGGHEYEDAKRDIEIWKSRVKSGGMLCGHDRNFPGVYRAINELLPGWKPQAGSLWSYQVA